MDQNAQGLALAICSDGDLRNDPSRMEAFVVNFAIGAGLGVEEANTLMHRIYHQVEEYKSLPVEARP